MFNPGDFAYDKTNNERVQIISAFDAWGFVSYKVYNPISNAVYRLSSEALDTDAQDKSSSESYLRYVALLSKIKNETSGGILSKLSNGVIPLPHQRYVLNRAISNSNIRYILADEVGLGKTIEAGLIIKELKTRGLVRRILVVCPTGLVTQWNSEMSEKFGEKFNIILPDEYATIRKITDSDEVYSQFNQVISPMDSIKPLERRAGWTEERVEKYNEERIYSVINSGWDLVIIDEAHRVAGSSGEVARYKLGNLLAAASPYLLLLSATPHNGKTEPFLRLIQLIDEKAFPNYKAIVKEQVAPYVIRTEKREAIDNNGNKLFKNRTTKAINLTWDERHSMQRKLYEMVTRYVSINYNKAMRNRGKNMWFIFLLIMFQRLVTSSTRAIRESLERRIRVLESQNTSLVSMSEADFTEMDLEMNMDDAITAMSLDTRDEIKELTQFADVDASFDLDASLKRLVHYYNDSCQITDSYADYFDISDPAVTRHLKSDIEYELSRNTMHVGITDFPNESGYFMIWELSVSSDEQSRRFIPVFINESFVLRAIAGKKIWDALISEESRLVVTESEPLPQEIWEKLAEISREHAYDAFLTLKDDTIRRFEETHRKYMYALSLRVEAAHRIGIDNIRSSKLAQLERERVETQRDYDAKIMLCPQFRPVMLIRMEGGNA